MKGQLGLSWLTILISENAETLGTMSTTPGQLAKFDPTGNVTDSIVTETGGGSIGIGTTAPSVRTQIEGTNDKAATLAIRRSNNNKFMRLGVGTQGAALDFDPTSFLVIQKNTLV